MSIRHRSFRQNFASVLLAVFFLFFCSIAYSATITSIADGNWDSTSTWQGGIVPGAGDDVVINNDVVIASSTEVEVNNLTITKYGYLHVEGGLLVNGNFEMQFNGQDYAEFSMADGAYVIIDGNINLTNKVQLSIASYFIVRGDIGGGGGQTDFAIETGAHVYLLGSVGSNLGVSTCGGYSETGTSVNCDYGTIGDFTNNYTDFPSNIQAALGCNSNTSPYWPGDYGIPHTTTGNIVAGGTITLHAQANPDSQWKYGPVTYTWTGPNDFSESTQNSDLYISGASTTQTGYYTCTAINTHGCAISSDPVYVHVGDCGIAGSRFYSKDNYTGSWESADSWSLTGQPTTSLSPPTNDQGGNTTIYGTISVNGNLTTTNSGFQICDTLIVHGDMVANSVVLSSTGVLIVLGDLSVVGGTYNYGKVIVEGSVNNVNNQPNNGDFYVFGEGSNLGNPAMSNVKTTLDDLKEDGELYEFYCAESGGGCQPNASLVVPAFIDGNSSVSCIPEFEDYSAFENASTGYSTVFSSGGYVDGPSVAVTQFSYNDVYTSGVCPKNVTRTYTVTLQNGKTVSAQQVFSLHDTEAPVINSGQPLSPIEQVASSSCVNTITINEPSVSDNCGYGTVDVAVSSSPTLTLTYDSSAQTVTGSFPLGTTTLTWTVTDECGNTASTTQDVVVYIDLTDISYDNSSTATGNGSGKKPLQTSTHSYQVDNGTAESGFTYTWELFDASNTTVSTSLYSISASNGGTTAQITFAQGLTAGVYSLKVTKDNGCSVNKTLTITVVSNSIFDVVVGDTGDDCQAGPDGTQTTISWMVNFPAVQTQPFQFTYIIKLDGIVVCSAAVTDISFTSHTFSHSGSCASVEFGSGPYILKIGYTINNEAGVDKALELSIVATDNFQVSEPQLSNNNDGMNAHGIPDTSDIQTD